MENVQGYLRTNNLCTYVWDGYEDILGACKSNWDFLVNDCERIEWIGSRKRASVNAKAVWSNSHAGCTAYRCRLGVATVMPSDLLSPHNQHGGRRHKIHYMVEHSVLFLTTSVVTGFLRQRSVYFETNLAICLRVRYLVGLSERIGAWPMYRGARNESDWTFVPISIYGPASRPSLFMSGHAVDAPCMPQTSRANQHATPDYNRKMGPNRSQNQ